MNENQTFLEQHHAVVLKLKIKAVDGSTQIRRVKLDRLAAKDGSGDISFEEIRRLSVTFSFGEKVTNFDDYFVSLTYYDSDNDMVSIGSKEELMDAVEQFSASTPPVVRITCHVAASTNTASETTKTQPTTASESATVNGTESTTDRGTSTRGDVSRGTPAVPPVPVQKVLESFVGVLSTAVHHLEGLAHHAADAASGSTGSATSAAAPAPVPSVNGTTTTGDQTRETSTPSMDSTPAENGTPTTQPDATPDTSGSGDNTSPKADGEQEEEDAKEEAARPFIHGRHTCDSCLSTPIIGKRFHSTNLPDYDLCQNCHANYQGSDIQFESVELDRDRPFQDRWHRRHDRNFRMRAGRRCGGGPARSIGGRRVVHPGTLGRGPRHYQHRHPHMAGGRLAREMRVRGLNGHSLIVRPSVTSRAESSVLNTNVVGQTQVESASAVPSAPPSLPSAAPPATLSSDFDNALKEAIRRSLNDIAPREAKIKIGSDKEEETDVASDDKAPVQDDDQGNNGVVVETVNDDEDDGKEEQKNEKNEKEEEEEKVPADTAKPETDIPRSVEVPMSGNADDDQDDSTLPGMEEAVAKILKNAMEQAMDTASVNSSKLVDENEDIADEDKKPAATTASNESSGTSSKKDDSFASDAIGNGDVAEAIGATLDMVVGQISDMLGEEEKSAEEEIGAEDSLPGQMIVDPQPATDEQQNETDGEWSVVNSTGSTESDGTTEEEQIARAATLLGSALYNSDMNTSVENVPSKMSASAESVSSFSVPSSVPTDLGANGSVAPTQLARWSKQLELLRALGFEESKCIEVLEHLSAANIGVDADEEVSLELVVHKLLEEQQKK